MDALIHVLIALAVVGVIVYLISLTPISAPFQRLIQVVALIGVVFWLLNRFGLFRL